jgi:hypothetical protein
MGPQILEENPLLDFYDNVNTNTGEIKSINRNGQPRTPFKNAFYNGFEFRIYSTGTITIAGSAHIYWNSGGHNYNDFNSVSFLKVVADLKNKFGIDLSKAIIKTLEIGVNIIPPIPTNDFLDYCFLHKTKPFEYRIDTKEGKYKQVQHSHYFIKLYNKALHYKHKFDIPGEILRFEIKYTKMEKINNRGIYSLKDLADYGLINFKDELILEFNNILYYDRTICSKSIRLLNYANPVYWKNLLNNPSKTNYYKHREILKQTTANHSDRIQFQIAKIIGEKIDYLNGRGASFDPLTIRSISTPPLLEIQSNNIYCPVTNINISMQKENSTMLSHTGLHYYYKTDRKVFEQIKRRYLSSKWQNADLRTQIVEIAHNIRNTKSNQNIKQKRIYPNLQRNLLASFNI